MKTKRHELIDFFKWLQISVTDVLHYEPKLIVNDYLKSINSKASNETPNVNNNEQKRKLCMQCGKYETLKGDGTIEPLCECIIQS